MKFEQTLHHPEQTSVMSSPEVLSENIVQVLLATEETAQRIPGIVTEQEQRFHTQITKERTIVRETYTDKEQQADAKRKQIIAEANRKYQEVVAIAQDSCERATVSINETEARAEEFFATCRTASERIYGGQKIHRESHDILVVQENAARSELKLYRDRRNTVEYTVKNNNDQLAVKESLIGTYDELIQDDKQRQRVLYEEDRKRADAGRLRREETIESFDVPPSDPADINAKLSDFESMGTGYGGDLIYTTKLPSVMQELGDLQTSINENTENRSHLQGEVEAIISQNEALMGDWAEFNERCSSLERYLREIADLKTQLYEEIMELCNQAIILETIASGGVEQLSEIPDDLIDVLTAAYRLMARREETPSNHQSSPTSLPEGLIVSETTAEIPQQSSSGDRVTFREGDSVDEAREAISATTHAFGLPSSLQAAFTNVAKSIKPGVYKSGVRLQISGREG